ncbi:MAG: hypothetical protein V4725_03240 [Bacteroidota bacterium]|nr:hypothetical protein [Ferruginibacter sp.]
MRKLLVVTSCIFFVFTTNAQSYLVDDLNQTVFLYPDFKKGKVLLKNKSEQQAIFNYNMLFQQMIYVQNSVMMALDEIDKIDTVFVDTVKFVPVDTSFYEVRLSNTNLPLFIKYQVDITPAAPATPYGGRSQTGAVQNITSYRFGVATPYQLKVSDAYNVRRFAEYYIKRADNFVHLKNAKHLKYLYPNQEKAIGMFIKQHHPSFNNTGDMERLVSFMSNLDK